MDKDGHGVRAATNCVYKNRQRVSVHCVDTRPKEITSRRAGVPGLGQWWGASWVSGGIGRGRPGRKEVHEEPHPWGLLERWWRL